MAAPAFVQAGTGELWQSGGAVTVSLTGATVGNVVIFQVLIDGSAPASISNHSGIEDLAGTDNSATSLASNQSVGSPEAARQTLEIGRAISSTVSVDISEAGGTDCYARWYEFSGVHTGTTLGAVREGQSNGTGTATAITDTGVTTTAADRLACQFVAVNDDNVVESFTGETGGDWVEATAEYATATGTDGCIQLQTATMASAGTINGGSYTMAASDAWGVIGLALIPATSTPTSLNPSLFERRTARRRTMQRT